jgi:hypothetical protein
MYKTFALILASLLLTSCISYHNEDASQYSRPVGLERNVTTEDWVYENLGKPYSKHTKADGTTILHYTYEGDEETKVSLLLVINIHNREKDTSHLYIELQDGVVIDFWDD